MGRLHFQSSRTLRVIEVRDDSDGAVLVVERPPRRLVNSLLLPCNAE